MIPSAVLLAGALGAICWFLRRDGARYASFKRLTETRDRQRRYRQWMVKASLAFGVTSIVALGVLGRLEAIVRLPAEFADAAALLPFVEGSSPAFAGGAASGALVGAAIVLVLRRRGGSTRKPIGDVSAMLPHNRAELVHAAALSFTAGIVEELFFRLLLPLLIALVTGSAIAGFAAATVVFGLMHRYQGWAGVAATTVVGVLMTAVHLATGRLWLAMLLHALIDLGGLVLRPALSGAWCASNDRDAVT